MQPVSDAYKREMQKRFLGEAGVRIEFGVVDVDAAATIETRADGGHMYWSSLETPFYEEAVPPATYATFEPGRFGADGRLLVAPAPTDALRGEAGGFERGAPNEQSEFGAAGKTVARSAQQTPRGEGYVSDALSGADGAFSSAPFLHLHFSKSHTVPGLAFVFDRSTGDYVSRLRVVAKRGGTVLLDKTYTPTGPDFETADEIVRFDDLTLTFLATMPARRRARLQQLRFGIGIVFTGQSISKTSQKMDTDPITRRLPKNTFNFSVVNFNRLTGDVNGIYSPDNPAGIWKYIDQQNPIEAAYSQTLTDGLLWGDVQFQLWAELELNTWGKIANGGTVQAVKAGRYYLTGQPTVSGLFADFKAQDLLSFADGTYYKGAYAPQGRSLYELAEDVLRDAALPLVFADKNPWKLWPGLQDIKTTAPVPVKKHKECLQLIAHAGRCALFTDRDGYICIQPAPTEDTGRELDFSYILEEPKVTKTATLKAVACGAYSYFPEEKVSELHKGTYTLDGPTALHVTYSQGVAEGISAPGAQVVDAHYYAAAADVTLTGSGPVELVITGCKLAKGSSEVRADVADADENGTVETLDNPLITDRAEALRTAEWVREYLLNRSTYEFSTRGNPELDPLDNIKIESQFKQAADERPGAVVLVSETSYNGSLSNKMTVKRMVKEA